MNRNLKIGVLFAVAAGFGVFVEATNEPVRPDWLFHRENDCVQSNDNMMTASEFRECLHSPRLADPS